MITRIALALAALIAVSGCSSSPPADVLTVYSGREEELVQPLFDRFTEATGIEIRVNYGDSAALAAQLLEEGTGSPADVFFSQDGGALGAVGAMLMPLPEALLAEVPERFRADDGTWVGISGRARTVVYNTDSVTPDELPDTILAYTDDRWHGRVGWAPTNSSFQAFVTALRLEIGDELARAWLRGMKSNAVVDYPKNTPIVQAVAAGEIEVGFVNHYYLLRILAEDPDAPAANDFIGGGDPGALINVAGAGILATSTRTANANELLEFLLDSESQRYFADDTFEYPLVDGVDPDPRLPGIDTLDPPSIDLSDLADLEGTLELLADEGIL